MKKKAKPAEAVKSKDADKSPPHDTSLDKELSDSFPASDPPSQTQPKPTSAETSEHHKPLSKDN
jgi:hypothetical protein